MRSILLAIAAVLITHPVLAQESPRGGPPLGGLMLAQAPIVLATELVAAKPAPAKRRGAPAPEVSQPIPDAAALAEARKLVKEIYAAEFEKASTPEELTALAMTLLTKGIETRQAAGRYALLTAARSIAVRALNVEVALRSVDAIGKYFQVDGEAEKKELLTQLAGAPRIRSRDRLMFIYGAQPLVLDAVRSDNYAIASWAAEYIVSQANKAHDKTLEAEYERSRDYVKFLADKYPEVDAANKALLKQPDNKDANAVVGRFYCFYKNEWDKGVPMLALANEPLAVKELRVRQLPANNSLADGWWDRAPKENVEWARQNLRLRAIYWYQRAQPNLAGIDQYKAKQRIADKPPEILSPAIKPKEEEATASNPNKPAKPVVTSVVGTYAGTSVIVQRGPNTGRERYSKIIFKADGSAIDAMNDYVGKWRQTGKKIRVVFLEPILGSMTFQQTTPDRIQGTHTLGTGELVRRMDLSREKN